MADLRETFPILTDRSNNEGKDVTAVNEGLAVQNTDLGVASFSFKDSSGNYVLPQLTSEGKLPVDFKGAGVPKAGASIAPVAGSTSNTTVATAVLATNKTVGSISCSGSCFTEAIFELCQVNDATTTVIASFLVGPGQFSFERNLDAREITTGATGTQSLILRAKNLNANKVSDFRGDVACLEFA